MSIEQSRDNSHLKPTSSEEIRNALATLEKAFRSGQAPVALTIAWGAGMKTNEVHSLCRSNVDLERGRTSGRKPNSRRIESATVAMQTAHLLGLSQQLEPKSESVDGRLPRVILWRVSRPLRSFPAKPVPKSLSDDKLARILSLLKDDPKYMDLHDVALITLDTAIRAGELQELRWANVDLERAQLTIPRGKSSYIRTAALGTEAVRILESVANATRNPSSSWDGRRGLFCTVSCTNSVRSANRLAQVACLFTPCVMLRLFGGPNPKPNVVRAWRLVVAPDIVHLPVQHSS